MAMNRVNRALSFDLSVIESFGDCSEINIDNGYMVTEVATLDRSVGGGITHAEAIAYWKDYCKQKRRPYVVMAGRVKPSIISKYEYEQKISKIRHAIYYPTIDTSIQGLAMQTGFDTDLVKEAVARMLEYKQIQECKNADKIVYKPVVFGESAPRAKFVEKPFPFPRDKTVAVLLRAKSDFPDQESCGKGTELIEHTGHGV